MAELLGDRVWHKSRCSRALERATHAVQLKYDGFLPRTKFASLLQHLVYFANHSQQLELAETECQNQNGRLTLGEFLRAAAAASACVDKAGAVKAFRTMAANEGVRAPEAWLLSTLSLGSIHHDLPVVDLHAHALSWWRASACR